MSLAVLAVAMEAVGVALRASGASPYELTEVVAGKPDYARGDWHIHWTVEAGTWANSDEVARLEGRA